MKVLAYIPVHYGSEYLHYSIKSIENHVDKILILYSDKPTFGHSTDIVCPESRDTLHQIAANASPKVEWVDIRAGIEAEHRNIAYNMSGGYDLLLAVDADEVWEEKELVKCLNEAMQGSARYYGITGFLNFWKSFNHVCIDGFAPIRITNLHNSGDAMHQLQGKVYHFSCAQSKVIMDYKYLIHGHKDEIRPNWLEGLYYAWTPEHRNLHPASLQVWGEAIPFDKIQLPELLKNHPYYNLEKIS